MEKISNSINRLTKTIKIIFIFYIIISIIKFIPFFLHNKGFVESNKKLNCKISKDYRGEIIECIFGEPTLTNRP